MKGAGSNLASAGGTSRRGARSTILELDWKRRWYRADSVHGDEDADDSVERRLLRVDGERRGGGGRRKLRDTRQS